MREIFFASDMHFGHHKILDFCERPFTSTEAMNESLVDAWNETVGTNDTVYHLGDWAFGDFHHIGRLRGNILSVPGNHDTERVKKLLPFLPNGFLPELTYLKVDPDRRFALCHYPMEAWHRHFQFHLHGHSHGTSRPVPNRLDVGLDSTKLYRPISLDEVLALIGEAND